MSTQRFGTLSSWRTSPPNLAINCTDRGVKFERYRAVPSLSEYLLVSERRIHVERWSRQEDGWLLREWTDPAAGIELASLGCRLRIAEIYAKVSFEEPVA